MNRKDLGRVLLITGGFIERGFLQEYLSVHSFHSVVCADAGLKTAYELKLPVDYFLGDFDSVEPEVLTAYQKHPADSSGQAHWSSYPPEKDDTDTALALQWILDRGAEQIVIFGATGGRMDHFLANVQLLMLPLAKNIPTVLIDSQNRIRLIKEAWELPADQLFGKYISLLPLTTEVTGVTLQGMKYPLENGTLSIGHPYAVSNEPAPGATRVAVNLQQGIMVVIESRDI